MADRKGHQAESDVEPEAHEARSRNGDDDGTYVGRATLDNALDVGESGAEARSKRS
jgi:hypothetical protein